jgi:hypothetical protein
MSPMLSAEQLKGAEHERCQDEDDEGAGKAHRDPVDETLLLHERKLYAEGCEDTDGKHNGQPGNVLVDRRQKTDYHRSDY